MALAKNKANRRRLQGVKVALEISRGDIHLLVVDQTKDPPRMRVCQVPWGDGSLSLDTDAGREALATALCELSAREQLAGATVKVALNSDFCLTRVLSGENEEVRRELKSLDDRSSLYLSLGAGENTFAVCTQALDAKHQQAFVTIANKQTVGAIRDGLAAAGFTVEVLEHSLVALARSVGLLEQDAEEPVLVLELNQRGVDLGISYRGQLLLDYRPGGNATKEQVASTVIRHLERLQRFCNKRFRFTSGTLSRIFLCGDSEEVQLACSQFAGQDRLRAEVLRPETLLERCGWPATEPVGSNFMPSIGTLAYASAPENSHSPNLVAQSEDDSAGTPWKALLRTAWPVAAALLLLVGIYGWNFYLGLRCSWLEQKTASFDSARQSLNDLQMRINLVRQETDQLTTIVGQVRPPAWHELLATIGAALPEGVWLERIGVDGDGAVRITGPSQSEDGVFEFVRLLKNVPALSNVALESTQPIQFNSYPATRFDITCRLASPIVQENVKP